MFYYLNNMNPAHTPIIIHVLTTCSLGSLCLKLDGILFTIQCLGGVKKILRITSSFKVITRQARVRLGCTRTKLTNGRVTRGLKLKRITSSPPDPAQIQQTTNSNCNEHFQHVIYTAVWDKLVVSGEAVEFSSAIICSLFIKRSRQYFRLRKKLQCK